MVFISILIAIVVIILLAGQLFRSEKCRKKMPPGPTGLPILGYLPFLSTDLSEKLAQFVKFKEKYGKIFSVKMGSHSMVVLSDYQLIKDAFNKVELTGRFNYYPFDIFTKGNYGLAASTGPQWHEQRRFAHRSLRDVGMGKSSFEEIIQNDVHQYADLVGEAADGTTEIDISKGLNASILNSIWSIIAGKRFNQGDGDVKAAFNGIQNITKGIKYSFMLLFVPNLIYVLPKFLYKHEIDLIQKMTDNLLCLCQAAIDERRAMKKDQASKTAYETTFIDLYLEEADKFKDDPKSTFSDLQLQVSLIDLFFAGTETTFTTMRWYILYLAYFQDVQKKLHEELDEVIGRERIPNALDKPRLPFLQATIAEALRFANIVPLGLEHIALEETTLAEYVLPKGTIVYANFESLYRDPKIWKHPDEFYPEHFLDEQGKLVSNKDVMSPFSIGKRSCIGESVARSQLFHAVAVLFHRFHITLPNDGQDTSLEPNPGSSIIYAPRDYKVIVTPR